MENILMVPKSEKRANVSKLEENEKEPKKDEKKEKIEKFVDAMNEIDSIWDESTIEFTRLASILGTTEFVPMIKGALDTAKYAADGLIEDTAVFNARCKMVIERMNIFLNRYNFALDSAMTEITKKGLSQDKKTGELIGKIIEKKNEISKKVGELKKIMI